MWEVGGETFGNHYLAGYPPISLERYRTWLPAIAALPRPFDASKPTVDFLQIPSP
jgi:hypothetical protein